MTLRSTLSTAEGKRRYVRRLFATIADRYDFITRFLSYGQDRRWKARLIVLADLKAGDRVLDLACGTGDLTFAAARSRAHSVIGLDLTHRMIQLAGRRRGAGLFAAEGSGATSPKRLRVGAEGPRIAFITGDMLALPFADARFDVVTTGYGLRNVPDLSQAIREIRRVLAPGGRLLALDFNRPENPLVRVAYLTYLTLVGSALGAVLHGDPDTYRYIPESIRQYPGAHGVARLLEGEGFEGVRVIPVLGGLMAIHTASVPTTVQAR